MAALSQALKNVRRSPYQAFAATILVLVTFVYGYSLLLFMLGSNIVLQYAESRPQVIAFFTAETPETQIQSFASELENDSRVSAVRIVNQEEALEIFKKQPSSDPTTLELVPADILPASLEVSTNSLQDLEAIALQLNELEGIDEVVYQKDIIENIQQWLIILRIIGVGMTIVFAGTAILIIMIITSIRIASRKAEIRVMRLIGATKWYIMRPFLLEGILYGMIGSIFAWGITYISLLYATPTIQSFFGDILALPVSPLIMGILLAGGIVTGACIGFIASFFSTRRLFRT